MISPRWGLYKQDRLPRRGEEHTDTPFTPFASNCLIGAIGVATETVTHHRDGTCPVLLVVTRGEELHHRLRDNRNGNLHAGRVSYQPVHLSGVLDKRGNILQSSLLDIGIFHQIHQPGTYDCAEPPAVK